MLDGVESGPQQGSKMKQSTLQSQRHEHREHRHTHTHTDSTFGLQQHSPTLTRPNLQKRLQKSALYPHYPLPPRPELAPNHLPQRPPLPRTPSCRARLPRQNPRTRALAPLALEPLPQAIEPALVALIFPNHPRRNPPPVRAGQ